MTHHLRAAVAPWPAAILLATIILATPGATRAADGKLRFEHLTTGDGLANGIVMAVVQDSRGFMWFGTWGGLDRYDGYEFVHFKHDPADRHSLSGSSVRALAEDREGLLWVATNLGLSRFDRAGETFTNFVHDPADPTSLGAGEVWALLVASDGTVWALTLGGGLNRYDGDGRFTHYVHDPADAASLSANAGRALAEDRRGYLWIGTSEDGLNRLDPRTGEVTRYAHDPDDPGSLSGNDVWSIYEDRAGGLWVGTRTHGLNRFDRETGRFVRYLPDRADPSRLAGGFVIDLAEDRDGELWIAVYDAGLHRYDRQRDAFVRYLPDPGDPASLSLFQVTCIYEDDAGALWVGTFGKGVERLDRGAAKLGLYAHVPGEPRSLGGEDVRVVYEDARGVLWIGTYDGGLTRFDRRTDSYTHFRHDPRDAASLSDNRIHTLIEDHRGRLWIGTWGGGLNRLEPAAGTFTHYRHDPDDPQSLADDDVRGLYEDADGRLWIATGAGGVDRLAPETGSWRHFPPDPEDSASVDGGTIFTLEGSRERGVLWLGMWGSGLDELDMATGKVKRYKADPHDPDAIASNDVWTLHESADGTLWVGTAAGLDRFDPASGVFTHHRQPDVLGTEAVYDVVEDEAGELWFSTGTGLTRFDPGSGRFRRYDKADGVAIGDLFDGCAYKSAAGEIFFGGKEGLLHFRPADVTDNPYVPPVVLTDFKIFNRPVIPGAEGSPLSKVISETDSLTLDHGASVITLAFAALNYRAAKKNRYAFRLEGLEESWNYVDASRRYATYTNLDPGSYVFSVRGSNNDGVWNETPRTLAIRVLPPFWGTWWFRGLAALAVAGVVWGGFAVHTAGIRAHNRRLEAEIRERRRAEELREQLIAELGRKNELLEAQKAELERFTYTVSHDLRAPLVTIKGFLGLLERDVAGGKIETFRRDVATIGDAATNMQRLLDELLELSRIGRVINPPEPVALGELTREAVATVAAAVRDRGVELAIAEPLPAVYGDRLRLLEVVQNLIDNAVKFLGDEPAPRVEVGARENGGEVLCYVRDNGIGIDPRYRQRIFDLFERLDPEVDGTGVGLAIVKRIVEVHGGRIWVESAGAGKGATFYFTLPACP